VTEYVAGDTVHDAVDVYEGVAVYVVVGGDDGAYHVDIAVAHHDDVAGVIMLMMTLLFMLVRYCMLLSFVCALVMMLLMFLFLYVLLLMLVLSCHICGC